MSAVTPSAASVNLGSVFVDEYDYDEQLDKDPMRKQTGDFSINESGPDDLVQSKSHNSSEHCLEPLLIQPLSQRNQSKKDMVFTYEQGKTSYGDQLTIPTMK